MTSQEPRPDPGAETGQDLEQTEDRQAEPQEGLGEAEVDSEVVGPSDADALGAAIVAARFSGPLPPPDILRAYGEVVDNGAERIFGMWEGETRHRQGLENRTQDAFISGTTRAQWMAFTVISIIGVGGLVLVALGQELVGLAGFFLALASVGASFFPRIRGKKGVSYDRGPDEGSAAPDQAD